MADDLSITGKRWEWPTSPSPKPVSPQPVAPWLHHILKHRGIEEPDAITAYLDKSLLKLNDPSTMKGMDTATARLAAAIAGNESITIYGDYDVDGVCSTTLLVEFLRQIGGKVDYYIPDRRSEGYGLNLDAVEEIAKHSRLLVTTDCGITAFDEITRARELGLDVIVVDHHQVPQTLPPAVACLNPHHPDCNFPFKGLCAAGVAFMLVGALRRRLRQEGLFNHKSEPDIRKLLDLVAVATVADMVPMQEDNRLLVSAGLKWMRQDERPGMRALFEVAKIQPDRMSTSDLGFKIGPRINARGRMGHAKAGVDLLLTRDPIEATQLAQELDAANLERRQIEQATVEHAIALVEQGNLAREAALVLHDPEWHPGILGLVASRMVHRFYRPTVVIGAGGKGSARSIEGLDLHSAIAASAQCLIRFGGHKAAAGLTISPENVPEFRKRFIEEVKQSIGEPPFVAVLRPDLEIPTHGLSLSMVDELDQLGPFGQHNPEPLFVSRGVSIKDLRAVGKDQTHLKLTLGNERLDGIAFGFGQYATEMSPIVDVAYRIERNSYRGRESLQLRVEDLRPTLKTTEHKLSN